MDTITLEEHIRGLAALPATEDPVVSCYAAVENGRLKHPNLFEEQIRALTTGLKEKDRSCIEDTVAPIRSILGTGLSSDAKGVAFFSRAGLTPHFLYLRFRVAVPTWTSVGRSPNIFHLVELKDTYDRYVVMLSTRDRVRIMEINLGEPKEHVRVQSPNVRKEARDRWTKEHYQRNLRENHHRFIKEQVRVLERLMAEGGHKHLVLVGHPKMTARVREELPRGLAETLVEEVRVSEKGSTSDIVQATIKAFVEAEERESRELAETLAEQVHSGGLAVAGVRASYAALERGQVDTLVLLRDCNPGLVWRCRACKHVFIESEATISATCPECDNESLESLNMKEELVRMAETQHCAVEVVNESAFLTEVEGVGCLLRYRESRDGVLSGAGETSRRWQPMWSHGNEVYL